MNMSGLIDNDLIDNFRFFPRWGNGNYLIEELSPEILLEGFKESPQFKNFSILKLMTILSLLFTNKRKVIKTIKLKSIVLYKCNLNRNVNFVSLKKRAHL